VPLELPQTGSAGWGAVLNAALTALDVRTTGSVNVRSHGALGNGVADDTAAVNAAIAAVAGTGGEVFFPPGVYLVSSEIVVPGGVLLRGTGIDYSVVTGPPARGSIIRATGAMASVVRLGSDSSSSVSGQTGASMWGLIVDGANLATAAVKTFGRRNYIQWCQVWRGASYAVDLSGQNSHLLHSVCGQNNLGSVVRQNGSDNEIAGCQIREGLNAQIEVVAGAIKITDNHMWTGANGQLPASVGRDIWIRATGTDGALWNVMINNNIIEGVRGPHIEFAATGARAIIENVSIVGNSFYNTGDFPDNTYPVLLFNLPSSAEASAQTVRNVTVVGNQVYRYAGTTGFKALLEKTVGASGVGYVRNIAVMGNVGRNMHAFAVGLAADDQVEALGNHFLRQSDGTRFSTSRSARATAVGDGAATAFSWAHGLSGTPRSVRVTPSSAAASEKHHVTADATNVTVTFAAAPANAAALSFDWSAEV
jgi:hypothetical protein